MFGEPETDGTRPAFDAIVERVAWWAELFELPCVAYAADPDEVAALAAAGADFVAIDVVPNEAPSAAVIRTAAERLHTDAT
jgi:thiamine-phosphate pyrophosphorylase